MKVNNVKEKRKFLKSKAFQFLSVSGLSLLVASQASAALPPWATGLGATLIGIIDDVVAAVGPVVIYSIVAFITFKLIRRGASKI